MHTIAIIDYRMGNVASVHKAFEAVGACARITYRRADIETADAIVLPGVGSFGDGMKNLRTHNLIEILNEEVVIKKKPFIGICIGMQLLMSRGHEFGEHEGLGWIEGETVKLDATDMRLPHIGWDDISMNTEEPLFREIKDPNFYFDHSFVVRPVDQSLVIATCTYGTPFAAAFRKDNIFAAQFHPEKSQESGLQLLKNFLSLTHSGFNKGHISGK